MDEESTMDVNGLEINGELEEKKEQRDELVFVQTLQELSRSMETIEENKVQEDQSETSVATEKECKGSFLLVHSYILNMTSIVYHL